MEVLICNSKYMLDWSVAPFLSVNCSSLDLETGTWLKFSLEKGSQDLKTNCWYTHVHQLHHRTDWSLAKFDMEPLIKTKAHHERHVSSFKYNGYATSYFEHSESWPCISSKGAWLPLFQGTNGFGWFRCILGRILRSSATHSAGGNQKTGHDVDQWILLDRSCERQDLYVWNMLIEMTEADFSIQHNSNLCQCSMLRLE